MDVTFLNSEHEAKFHELRKNLAEYYRSDKEYLSVIYLMAGCEVFHQKAEQYFDGQEGFFNSGEMFEEQDFSTGIGLIAKLAVNLFNSNKQISPVEMVAYLSPKLFELAINAIVLRKYGLSE